MSAARSLRSTVQGNSFFINITAFTPGVDSLDATGTAVAVAGLQGAQAAGALVLRDMGKTVRVPATSSSGSTQRILRKVQRFDGGADTTGTFPVTNGFVGFNEGVGGAADSSTATGYETFYVELSGFNGSTTRFARLAF